MPKVLIHRAFNAEYFLFLTLVQRMTCFEVKRQYMIDQFLIIVIYEEPIHFMKKIINNNS